MMNPLRTLLNSYKHTTGLGDVTLQTNNHTGTPATIMGVDIIAINPQGVAVDGTEIPYHRILSVKVGDTVVYNKGA